MKYIIHFYLIQLFVFIRTVVAYDPVISDVTSRSIRLPSTVKPDHYLIKVNLNAIDNREFYGETNTTINVMSPVNNLTLHAKNLNINEINLISNDGLIMMPNYYSIDSKTNFLTMNFSKLISTGKYILNFKYTGIIITEMRKHKSRGFFANYDNELGFYIITRMLAIGARQIFPCWDEPSWKANFTIIVKHNARFTALSNMHAIKIEIDKTNTTIQTTTFANTPKMSTHSVAIVVADLVYHESNNGVIKLWSTKSNINKIKYTADIAEKILDAMKNYTNFAYTDMGFKKLDIVIMPNIYDLIGSWGLIISSKHFITNDNLIIDIAMTENSIKDLCHACVQQWFGNLVTETWWSDLWFYNGIINYLKFFITEQITDSWRIMDRIIINLRTSDLFVDDIEFDVRGIMTKTLDDNYWTNSVSHFHNSINIFYMASHVFGITNFQNALKIWLQNHAFKTASFDDFIDTLTSNNDNRTLPCKEILKNWITMSGYPIINVQRNYTAGTASLSQSHFLNNYNQAKEHNRMYWIPIDYISQGNIDFQNYAIENWLNPTGGVIEINGLKNDEWIILNKQWFGYYCVNYDVKNWQLIINTLKSNSCIVIHVSNRAQLLWDAVELTMNNQLDYGTLISLIGYLEYETDILPWIIMWDRIVIILMKLITTKYYTPFLEYLSILPNKLINSIEYHELIHDHHITKLYRNSAFNSACSWGSSSCLNKSAVFLTKWLENPKQNLIPLALRETILCYGVRGGDQKIWDTMMEKWILEQKIEILYALGCSFNRTNLNKLLSKVLKVNVNEMIIHTIFGAITHSDRISGQGIILDFVIQNWKSITPIYRSRVFHYVTFYISQKSCFEKINDFLIVNEHLLDEDVKIILKKDIQKVKRRFANHNLIIPELDEFFVKHNSH